MRNAYLLRSAVHIGHFGGEFCNKPPYPGFLFLAAAQANDTAVAYPTRIRSKAFAWTDGLGHLGAWAGVTLLGPLYAFGPDHLGWILWIIIPGALLPAVLIRFGGIRQARAVLEQIST
jgi:hypothetical protein